MLNTLALLAIATSFSPSLGTATVASHRAEYLAGGFSANPFAGAEVMVSSGDTKLDAAISADIKDLSTQFGVSVPLYFMVSDVPNAFFTPEKFPELIRRDGGNPRDPITGSVFVTTSLINSEFENTGGSGLTIPAIVAHEYAHAMQYRLGFPLDGKWRELHADYMAGWFTAHRGRNSEANDPEQAMRNFYSKGDYHVHSEGHHGTPRERAQAFINGYTYNMKVDSTSAVKAYNAELTHMRQLIGE